MIISFEVARQERRGSLPLHDTRTHQILRRTNQNPLPLSNRLQTRARKDVAGKEPGVFERSTLLGNPACGRIWVTRPPFLVLHGPLQWSHLEFDSSRATLRPVLRQLDPPSHTIIRLRDQSPFLDVSG